MVDSLCVTVDNLKTIPATLAKQSAHPSLFFPGRRVLGGARCSSPCLDQQRRHDFPDTDWAVVKESRASPGDFTLGTLVLAFISSVTLGK